MAERGGDLASYGKTLEDAFFFQKENERIEKHRVELRKENSIKALGEISGIENREILAKLVEMGITPEMALMLAVVPLVEVAWADGTVDDRERKAVMAGAEKVGVAKGRLDHEMLELWLTQKPAAGLMDAWCHFITGMCEGMTGPQKAELREEMVSRAREVAKASGSILGLTSGISAGERRVIERLESAFC